ncbi:MAG: hypothetical protein AB1726_03485, partial [Planctomycetota bacterium]
METLRSPILWGSSGGPFGTERSPLPPSAEHGARLFAEEMERAVEQSGGEEAVQERIDGHRRAQRAERRAGFAAGRKPAPPSDPALHGGAASEAPPAIDGSSPLPPPAAPVAPASPPTGGSGGAPSAAPPAPPAPA